MTKKMKLLQCPFCGSDFKISQEPHDNHPVAGQFYIYHEYGELGSRARECRLDIKGHFENEQEALAFWNSRTALHPPLSPNGGDTGEGSDTGTVGGGDRG